MAKYENPNEPKHWFVDSGCSNHMTYNKSLFSLNISRTHGPVELGNNNPAKVLGTGSIYLDILANGKRVNCRINNVLYVTELG